MNTCHNNAKKSSATKINIHPLVIHCLHTVHFMQQKNKLDYYRGKKYMKKVCLDLRKHATKAINYQKKEMIPLTKEEKKIHRKQKICYYAKKDLVLMIT